MMDRNYRDPHRDPNSKAAVTCYLLFTIELGLIRIVLSLYHI